MKFSLWMSFTLIFASALYSQDSSSSCRGSIVFNTIGATGVKLPASNHYYSGDNNGYTWECWFRLNEPFDQQEVRPLIVSVDAVVFEDMWLGFGWNGGWYDEPVNRLVFKVDGPNSTSPSGPNCSYEPSGGFLIGTWYHAAGVMDYSNQVAKLYVNGVPVDSVPITTPPNTREISTYLSYDWVGGPESLRGNMDEVRIWDRPRTAAEIADNYDKCVDPNESNLFVYYKCNGYGELTLTDATSNQNTGIFLNVPDWSYEEPNYTGTLCGSGCTEICGNGTDDNGNGEIDENCDCSEEPSLFIPNVITVNSDEVNDRWQIKGDCIKSLDGRIINRWGEAIAVLAKPGDFWDGTYNGSFVSEGVYTYLVHVVFTNDKELEASGFIELVR